MCSLSSYKTNEEKRTSTAGMNTTRDSINFIDHNKQTLYNITTLSPRPVSDNKWVRKMRKPAQFHMFTSSDFGFSGPSSVENIFLEPREKDATFKSTWKSKPETSVNINLLNFSELNGEVIVNPNYNYCDSCMKGTSPLILRGRNLRPRLKIRTKFY